MPLTPDELMYYLNPSMGGDIALTGKKAVEKQRGARPLITNSSNSTTTKGLPTLRPSYDPYLENVNLGNYSSDIWGSPLENEELTVGDISRLGEIAADSQGAIANLLFRLPLRTAVPAVTKWLQGTAMLGIAPIAAGYSLLDSEEQGVGDVLNMATDNPIVNGLQAFEDYFKSEVVPVYKRDDWGQMNVWEKLGTDPSSWFADELADGVAFAASSLLGGGLLGKALKPGTKLMKGLATSVAAEGNIAKGLSALTSAEKAMPALKSIENFALKSGKNIDNAAAWGLMTGQEALFETKEFIESATQSYMKDLGLNEEEAHKMAVQQAPAIFSANMAILGLSNAWELSRLGKILGNTGEGTGRIVNKAGSLGVEEKYLTKAGRWMNTTQTGFRTKTALEGIGMEGLWEENMQGAVKDVLTNYGLASNRDYSIGQFAGDALAQGFSNIFNPDKHEEILLGAVIGGGMSQIAAGKEFTDLRTRTKDVLNNINGASDNMMDLNNLFVMEDEVDYDGKVVGQRIKLNEQGEPEINPKKIADLNNNLKELDDLQKASQAQLAQGNLDSAELYADAATDKWIRAHLEAGLGGLLKEKVKAMSKFSAEELEKLGIPTKGIKGGKEITYQDNLRNLQERVDYMLNLNDTLEDSISITSPVRDARIKEALRVAGLVETLKQQRSTVNQKLASAESKLMGENAPYNKAIADLEVLESLEKLNEGLENAEEKEANKKRISKRKESLNNLLSALREGNDTLPKTNEFVGLTGPEMLEYKDAKKKSLALENNIISLSGVFDKLADNKTGDSSITGFVESQLRQKDKDLEPIADQFEKGSPLAQLFNQQPDGAITPTDKFFVVESNEPRKALTVLVPWRNPKTGTYVLRPIEKMRVKGPSTSDIALDELPDGTVMSKEEVINRNQQIIKQNRGYDFIQAIFKRRTAIKQELATNGEAWSALFNIEAKLNMYKRQLQQALDTLTGEELVTTLKSIQETITELEAEQRFVEDYIQQLEKDLETVQAELNKYYQKVEQPDGTFVNQYLTEEAEADAGAVLDIENTLRQELNSLNKIKSDYTTIIDNLKELLNKVVDAINAIIGRPKGDRRTKEGATKELLRSIELNQEKKNKERYETELQKALEEASKIEDRITEIEKELANLPYIVQLYNEVIAEYSIQDYLEEYTSNSGSIFEEPTNTPAPVNMRKKDQIASSAGLHAEYEINGDKISTIQTEDGAKLNEKPDVLELVTMNGIEKISKAALRFYNFMSTFRLKPGTATTIYFKAELGSQSTDPENYAEQSQINLVLYQDGQPVTDETGEKLVIPMHTPSYVERLNLSPDTDPELMMMQWAQVRKETAARLLKGEDVYFKVNGKSTGMLNYVSRKNGRRGVASIFGTLLGSPTSDLAIRTTPDGKPVDEDVKAQNKEIRRLRRALVKRSVGLALTTPQGESSVKIAGKEYKVPDGGGIYVLFQMGDGKEYPVRLNTRYASRQDGKMVVDLLNAARKGVVSMALKGTSKTLPIFGSKTKEGLIDTIIRWGTGNNPGTQIYIEGGKITPNAILVFGSNKLNLNELDDPKKQEELITWIAENKLRNISKSMFEKAMNQKEDTATPYFESYAIDTATNEVMWNRWDSYLGYLFNEKRDDGEYHTPIAGTDVVSRDTGKPQILQSYLTYDPVFSSTPPTGGNNVTDDVAEYPYWKIKQRAEKGSKSKIGSFLETSSIAGWTSSSTDGWGNLDNKIKPESNPKTNDPFFTSVTTTSTASDPWFNSQAKPVETKVIRSAFGTPNSQINNEISAEDALNAAALGNTTDLPTQEDVNKKEESCSKPD